MAAIVAGASLGLTNSSLALLGAQGQVGSATHGASGERVYLNSTTGNLVIQRRDELVVGVGNDIALVRTYNSQGRFDDDNGEQKPVRHDQGIKITPPSGKEVPLTCRGKAKAQYGDLADVVPEP